MATKTFFRVLIAVVVLLVACNSEPAKITLDVGAQILIPDGYTLIGVSSWGEFSAHETFYCKNNKTGRAYVCNDRTISTEIIVPDGYTLVDVTGWGRFNYHPIYYCQKNGTNAIVVCNPK